MNFAARAARHQKEAKHRELFTGGRFGQEAVDFVDSLGAAQARDSPRILHWRMRSHWCRAMATHGQALTVVCQIWLICFTGSEFVSKSCSQKMGRGLRSSRGGERNDMFLESAVCDEKAAVSRRRSRRRQTDLKLRAARAEMLVQLGEFSSARLAMHWRERS